MGAKHRQGLAPTLDRFRPRIERARLINRKRAIFEGKTAAVARRLNRHPDVRHQAVIREPRPPEDEATAWVRLDYIPPHPPLRPHQDRARANRKAALDPFRKPASQLLWVGPRAE